MPVYTTALYTDTGLEKLQLQLNLFCSHCFVLARRPVFAGCSLGSHPAPRPARPRSRPGPGWGGYKGGTAQFADLWILQRDISIFVK